MTAKELIKSLLPLDSDVEVCVLSRSGKIDFVEEREVFGRKMIIASDKEVDSGVPVDKVGKPTYALDLFIEEEIPFRLKNIQEVDAELAEEAEENLLTDLCVSRGGNFDFFDYDGLDSLFSDIVKEINGGKDYAD